MMQKEGFFFLNSVYIIKKHDIVAEYQDVGTFLFSCGLLLPVVFPYSKGGNGNKQFESII